MGKNLTRKIMAERAHGTVRGSSGLPVLRPEGASGWGRDLRSLIRKEDGRIIPLILQLKNLSPAEREILLAGSLINFYTLE